VFSAHDNEVAFIKAKERVDIWLKIRYTNNTKADCKLNTVCLFLYNEVIKMACKKGGKKSKGKGKWLVYAID
jgi:hypothetical protein